MKLNEKKYKAVFFDAGDTLLTIPEIQVILHSYLAERDFHAEQAHIERTMAEAIRRFYVNKETDAEALCSPESDRTFWVEIYRYAMGRLGIDKVWTEEEMHQCCHELYDMFVAPEYYELFDDVKPVLEALHGQGYRLGVISNFAPTLKQILLEKGILHYFDPVVVSTEAGLEKPNPEIFRLALQQSGLQPDELLYVGDHEINDVWASAQAGIDSVRIKRYAYMEGEGIATLRELKRYL